ncbi:MAG: phage tail tape measure protein, partial [Candidatus Nanopelagicaceae bacterium]
AKAAATGAQGADLLAATTQATRLATLGQIDYQQALDATISLQTALGVSSGELAEATDFLNAVENQTVTSLDDITQAIPLVAPVVKGLGGDVKDLAIFMTAMREGGISANEGANALKSGLASLINPTRGAKEQLEKVGINIDSILSKNKGDLRGLVMEFGEALGTLGKFERQQTLAKMFGKYQFSRMGALFSNISKEGSQAARVMDLTAMSAKELGQIAEGELSQLEESVGVKFTAAVEKLKLAIAPIGEAFLKIATPIIDFASKIADAFNNLPDAAKTFITWGAAIGGVLVPTIIMLVGLLGNFAGNMLKIGAAIGRLMGKTTGLSSGLEYLTMEELLRM